MLCAFDFDQYLITYACRASLEEVKESAKAKAKESFSFKHLLELYYCNLFLLFPYHSLNMLPTQFCLYHYVNEEDYAVNFLGLVGSHCPILIKHLHLKMSTVGIMMATQNAT